MRGPRRVAALLAQAALAAGLAGFGGCGASTADVGVDPGARGEGTTGPEPSGSRDDYCRGSGAPLVVGDGPRPSTCAGDLASVTFRFALCSCEAYVGSEALITDAFDARSGAPLTGTVAGSVGVNGKFDASGPLRVGGSLWVSSEADLVINGEAEVGAELYAGGRLSGSGSLRVGADAYVAGEVALGGFVPGGAVLAPPGGAVPRPCACDPAALVNVAGFIAAFRERNDNAAIGLDARALDSYAGAASLALPCGRYYLTRAAGDGPLALEVGGRVALFVGGDLSLGGDLSIAIAPGAELDLFVGGNVNVAGAFGKGAEQAPSRVRTYVAGGGTLNLQGPATLGGNLYAPRAELVAARGAEVFGSVFARRVSAAGPLTLHYDASVLASACPPSSGPAACLSCEGCGNQACIEGACGACRSDADCCSPLKCSGGRCDQGAEGQQGGE
jgi:hypothetical protein